LDARRLLAVAGLLFAGPAYCLHVIHGMAWRDYDANGIRDPVESSLGIANVTFELRESGSNALVASTTPAASGMYTFSVPGAGLRTFRVRVVHSSSSYQLSPRLAGSDLLRNSDFHPTGPSAGYTDPITVVSNLPVYAIDAGMDPSDVVVGNRTWLDLDADGVQDTGEPGLAGIDVELWSLDRSTRYATTTTNANGAYTALAPGWGSFRLKFSLPPGGSHSPKGIGGPLVDSDVIPSGPDAGWTDEVALATNLISTSVIDAGYVFANPVEVGLEYTNVPTLVQTGTLVGWTLWLRETIQRNVGSVRVRSNPPPGLSEFSWQCTAQGGAACPPTGTGALDLTLALPANGQLRVDFNARVGLQADFPLLATVEVAPPQIDVAGHNNLAQATLRNDRLFSGGFEPGG
jgi:hypothetical protein